MFVGTYVYCSVLFECSTDKDDLKYHSLAPINTCTYIYVTNINKKTLLFLYNFRRDWHTEFTIQLGAKEGIMRAQCILNVCTYVYKNATYQMLLLCLSTCFEGNGGKLIAKILQPVFHIRSRNQVCQIRSSK